MARPERKYQADLIKTIEKLLPGCMVLKNDTDYLQGIPDLTILYRGKWACLEVKKAPDEITQPNQTWYVDRLNEMSYAAFIFPENEKFILKELVDAMRPRSSVRRTR